MITGKTSQGFEFEVDETVMNDWDYINAIRKAESKDPGTKLLGTADLIVLLLKEDQAQALSDFIRSKREDGKAPFEAMQSAVNEILKICKDENEKAKK